METLLIKNILFGDHATDILIQDGRFKDLSCPDGVEAGKVLDGTGKAIVPSFFNAHNHSAMMAMRGYGDDRPLHVWLQQYIWPFENKMTDDDIRDGYDKAISEMIASGTTCFNDMYFGIDSVIDLVSKSGMRAAVGITVMENHSKIETDAKRDFVKQFKDPTGGRIKLVMAPHAIYTVGTEKLRETAEFARKEGLKLHIHLSETRKEVEDSLKEFGMTPVRYLDSIGFLGPDVIAAHCVHVDEEEWDILAERGVTVAHCPCSNMKLGSGRFPYELAIKSGTRIALGTDGVSSNNNLDLREEMKFAALLAKVAGDPELLPAEQVFDWATRAGAEALGFDCGVIAEGKLADCLLLDLTNPLMQPCHNLMSNWVYAADKSCISAVICDGKVL